MASPSAVSFIMTMEALQAAQRRSQLAIVSAVIIGTAPSSQFWTSKKASHEAAKALLQEALQPHQLRPIDLIDLLYEAVRHSNLVAVKVVSALCDQATLEANGRELPIVLSATRGNSDILRHLFELGIRFDARHHEAATQAAREHSQTELANLLSNSKTLRDLGFDCQESFRLAELPAVQMALQLDQNLSIESIRKLSAPTTHSIGAKQL